MIDLEHIHRVFEVGDEQVHALDDVTLSIPAGDYLSIMGPSGSGKSTLLNLLGLLDKPTSGIYRLDGRDTTSLSEAEQALMRGTQIGFVFQFFHLVPRMTAFENVELPLVLAGEAPATRRAKVSAILDEVGLADRGSHRPDQLSGGQRQRVAIARATIMAPKVLLADEPTGNLDTHSGSEVIDILEALNRNGLTLIVVTHDAALGKRAPRKLSMVDGRVVGDERRGGKAQ